MSSSESPISMADYFLRQAERAFQEDKDWTGVLRELRTAFSDQGAPLSEIMDADMMATIQMTAAMLGISE